MAVPCKVDLQRGLNEWCVYCIYAHHCFYAVFCDITLIKMYLFYDTNDYDGMCLYAEAVNVHYIYIL